MHKGCAAILAAPLLPALLLPPAALSISGADCLRFGQAAAGLLRIFRIAFSRQQKAAALLDGRVAYFGEDVQRIMPFS